MISGCGKANHLSVDGISEALGNSLDMLISPLLLSAFARRVGNKAANRKTS
jgi:hypothetical protein